MATAGCSDSESERGAVPGALDADRRRRQRRAEAHGAGADQRSTIRALALDPLDAQIRQVFFFDTPDLALDSSGLVVRARRVQLKGDDSVVKLRPVVPNELPKKLRRTPGFGVEVDAMPGGFVCSASMKGRSTGRSTTSRARSS